jgi:catechol 2,3-dioxygenase-like lactoylglutathione lyase family enzyme
MVLDTSGVRSDTAAAGGAPTTGVPGAQRVDHIALTVGDLDAAVEFVVDVLGGEVIYRLPPLAHADDWMRDHLDVHPRASTEIALLRLGPTTNLELFEYAAPDHNPVPPLLCDVGSEHFGILVDDIDAAAATVTSRSGLAPLGPIRTEPDDSPQAGTRWVRFRTPWGLAIELRQMPAYLPYERDTSGRRYRPSLPAAPGLRHLDHIGYTVADLDAALAIFIDVLGGELLYRSSATLDDSSLAESLGAPAGGRVEHAVLRMGPTDNIELYAYDGRTGEPPRNSDVGGRHLALHVRDVDAAAAYLAGHPGFVVLGAPETIEDGPIAGDRWVYVRSPLGLHIEVVRMPDGFLPYERDTTARRCPAGDLDWTDR